MTDDSAQESIQAARELLQQGEDERALTQSAEDWDLEKRERSLIHWLRISVCVISLLMLVFLGCIVTEETLLKGDENNDEVVGAVALVAPIVGMTTITVFLLFAVFRGVKEGDMTHHAISAGRQTGVDPTP